MHRDLKKWDSARDAALIEMIASFESYPFVTSLDNFQKGYQRNNTSAREKSKFFLMTDMSAAYCSVKSRDLGAPGGVGSFRRPANMAMTCGADFGGTAEDEELLSRFNVKLAWLSVMGGSESDASREGNGYLTVKGKAKHDGHFGIGQNKHFGIGAFPVHPDRDVDTVVLMCMFVLWFSQIHCPEEGPKAIPFALVFTLDQKCYDNVRKSIAVAATLGHGILDCIFPVPDHWHATQAAGFAAIANHACWHFFTRYRRAVFGDKFKADHTPDTLKIGMGFDVMYRHLRIVRLGWLRVRGPLLEAYESLEYIDPDLDAFLTWNEYIVPVIYDLLCVIKHSSEVVYDEALTHFVVVLYMLDRTNYVNAFDLFLRDLNRIRRVHIDFHSWFMANLNRVLVCLHIEYQHKEIAPFTEHLTERDANAVDEIICTLPAIRDSNVHAKTYKGLQKRHGDGCSTSSTSVHDENHVAAWAAAARTEFWDLATTSGRSKINGDTIESPRFGKYPAKLTRRDEYCWAERWSKHKDDDGQKK